MRHVVAACLAAALLGAGCGGSEEEQRDALGRVCDARAEIQGQVESLRGLTLDDVRQGQIDESLRTIRRNLETIRNAQPELADDRRSAVQNATDAFAGQVRETAGQLAVGLTRSDASEQVRAALDELASGFRDTYGPVDCPGG